MEQRELDRDPAAHTVADQVGALDLELVEQGDHAVGEVGRVVGCDKRLVGVTEPGQVERDHPVAIGERGDGGQEGGLRAPRPVDADHRIAARPRRGSEILPRRVWNESKRSVGRRRGRWWRRESRPRGGGSGAR